MTLKEFEQEWYDSNDYIVCHTSGSTGTPKEIHLSKEFMRDRAQTTVDLFGINSESRLHSCLDFKFIGGKMLAVRGFITGARVTAEEPSNHVLGGFSPCDTLDLVSVVPAQAYGMLRHLETLPYIRNILIGGSAINPELRRMIAASGLNCVETYGMTETASHIAVRKVTEDASLPFELLPGTNIRLDSRGCLEISIVRGNEGKPLELTTNDCAEILDDGRFTILGRFDDIIISGGKKINPREVEDKILEHFGLRTVITSRQDILWGERLVAVIESTDPEAEELQKHWEEFREKLKEVLPGWKVPKEIVEVKEFRYTENGKIKRDYKD